MKKSHFNWILPVASFLLVFLIFLSLSRILMVVWQFDRVSETGGLWFVLFQGIRFDLSLLAVLLVVPFVMLPIFCIHPKSLSIALWALKLYLLVLSAVMVFLELATPNFIQQFDFRPNILFLEYLKYPKEILTMLAKGYPLQLLLSLTLTGFALFGINKLLTQTTKAVQPSIIWSAPFLSLLAFILCLLAARSTLDHRPVNPSTVAFSNDSLVNSLALSSSYSVAYALYEKLSYENGDEHPYGNMAQATMLDEIYRGMGMTKNDFSHSEISTLHVQKSKLIDVLNKPKNLVIILEESLGANYVGKLGGHDVTPNLDALAQQGIWFNQLYATGTRSVRGIEAVVTGFLPTPARSIVKLGGSQHNFFTLAQLLSQQQYSTSFIYGGEAHFDNMKRFFAQNGFNHIIDENDYDNPDFYGSWGVSDQDLFNKAHDTFSQLHNSKTPFFSLVFTSSNHSPFDFPVNRIELVEQPRATVKNAVKYADFALGEYIAKAKKSDYWEDTVFLIIADHSDRVFGSDLVPIKQFRIPGLILGEGIAPKEVNRIVSQIDMLPTLLSLIGVTTEHPAIGIDLTRPDLADISGRAIMQYGSNQAYLENEKVIILQKDLQAQQFDYQDEKLIPSSVKDLDFEQRSKAHALWAMWAYKSKAYRLSKQEIKAVVVNEN